MRLYNFLTNNEEIIDKKSINWYCCGPTVHAATHMGHARTFSIFDSMRKYMSHEGINVNFGMNITDIDDKINNKVKYIYYTSELQKRNLLLEKTIEEIMSKFSLQELENMLFNETGNDILTPPMSLYFEFVDVRTQKFWDTLNKINVSPPTTVLRVSDVLKDGNNKIEKFIDKLIKDGYAYESNGSVYFDTMKYENEFGVCPLTNSTKDDLNLKDGYISDKKFPEDFALWKKSKPNSVCFNSKWGKGIPGWHIECSVMSNIMFGNEIDIHSGGIDLKFPHHHNEVLQSESYHRKQGVFKLFTYTGHLCIDNEKMAQSVGNYTTVDEYLSKHSANSLRLLFWLVPPRNPMNLTDNLIGQAEALEQRINEFMSTLKFYIKLSKDSTKSVKIYKMDELKASELLDILQVGLDYLHDDFSTELAIRQMNIFMTECNKLLRDGKITDSVFLESLSLKINNFLYIIGFVYDSDNSADSNEIKIIEKIAEIRDEIRKNKLFILSDKIRDVIIPSLGYVLQDTPDGSKIKKA